MDIAIGEIIILLIAIMLLFVYLYNEKKSSNIVIEENIENTENSENTEETKKDNIMSTDE